VLKSIPYVSSIDKNQTTVVSLLSRLEEESNNRNTTFKLSDFATVTLGYLTIASFVVLVRYGLIVVQKGGRIFRRNSLTAAQNNRDEAPNLQRVQAQRIHNIRRGLGGEDANDLMDDDIVGLGDSIGTAMDATVAIIKVCVLLFMKMFLLPLSLGLWLDASTARFFGHDIASRLAFAGSDLFSFLLLHWVAGITFMLLVTVFLLQLREVTHPDILARLIRPQEPQPDLLGNLMHETVLTHMKRMLLSLAIYAPLLTLHVTLPVMLFQASGLENIFTFFHLNFCHILTPQLQIPLELITFHLSMLALLERHKNTIGGLQHRWMKFMCRKMGLTEYILPRRIKEFKLIGTKSVFLPHDKEEDAEIDPFFTSLATKEEDIDQFILFSIDKCFMASPSWTVLGEQRLSGERVLSIGIRSISFLTKTAPENDNNKLLLPTKIGRYRLRIEDNNTTRPLDMKIEFFQEIQGDEIKRPPDGWDDLGAGGAGTMGLDKGTKVDSRRKCG
jgi:E3 ubiquitin-protein ligase MARCH6